MEMDNDKNFFTSSSNGLLLMVIILSWLPGVDALSNLASGLSVFFGFGVFIVVVSLIINYLCHCQHLHRPSSDCIDGTKLSTASLIVVNCQEESTPAKPHCESSDEHLVDSANSAPPPAYSSLFPNWKRENKNSNCHRGIIAC